MTKLRFINPRNFSYFFYTRIRKKFSPQKKRKRKKIITHNVIYFHTVLLITAFTSFRAQTFIGIDKFSWPDEFDKFPPRSRRIYSTRFPNCYWCTVIPDRKFRVWKWKQLSMSIVRVTYIQANLPLTRMQLVILAGYFQPAEYTFSIVFDDP